MATAPLNASPERSPNATGATDRSAPDAPPITPPHPAMPQFLPRSPKSSSSHHRRKSRNSTKSSKHSVKSPRDSLELARSPSAPTFAPIEDPIEDGDPFETSSDSAITDNEQKDVERSPPQRQRTRPGYVVSTQSPRSPVRSMEDLQDSIGIESTFALSTHGSFHGSLSARLTATSASLKPAAPPPYIPPPRPVVALKPIKPTFFSLFTLNSGKKTFILLLPALLASILGALAAPFMSIILGDAFRAMASYPRTGGSAEDKHTMLHAVATTSIKLVVIGGGAVACEYAKLVSWTRFSEESVARLRAAVFHGVRAMPMEWFDLGMGMSQTETKKDKQDEKTHEESATTAGAGGIMSKFTRETEDVRMCISANSGAFVQSVATFLACMVLAFKKDAALAGVMMACVPFLAAITFGMRYLVEPMYVVERASFAQASTTVERVTDAITTVKIHNAQKVEHNRFMRGVTGARDSLIKQAAVWATFLGGGDFLTFVMFVAGLWFGAKRIDDGAIDVAKLMTVFWACVLGTSTIPAIGQQWHFLSKGMGSLASLKTLIRPQPTMGEVLPRSPRNPVRCRGGFEFKDVSFAYPARPDVPVLQGISILIPPGETTFIVGGTGSGKSTIAQLLMRMYQPPRGLITLDNYPLSGFDPRFTRRHIAAVQQGCYLFEMSVHDNVAIGVLSSDPDVYGNVRKLEDVSRDEVINACKLASIHEFIETLPKGYDTKLGPTGSRLSGGQTQRIAIARARIRDPTVLILDEATSALDATSRVEVFEAVRRWRHNSTTIVITHDLSQIKPDDFAYVMKDGVLVEQGFCTELMKLDGYFASMSTMQGMNPLPAKIDFSWKSVDSGVEELLEDELDELAVLHTTTKGFRASLQRTWRPLSVASYYEIFDDYLHQHRRTSTDSPRASMAISTTPASHSMSSRHSIVGEVRNRRRASGPGPSPLVHQLTLNKLNGLSPIDEKHPKRFSAPKSEEKKTIAQPPQPEKRRGFFALVIHLFPSLPSKPLFFLGMAGAIGRGVATPLWSYFIAKVLALLAPGTMSEVTSKGAVLVGISVAAGLATWSEHYFLHVLAAKWNAELRRTAFGQVLKQDMTFFDETANSPARMSHHLIKDVDDMRALFASVLPRLCVVTVMVSLGLIWAMVSGWQLTLVSFGIVPFFVILMGFTSATMAIAEAYNKRYRDSVARTLYESVANIRSIRSMAMEQRFTEQFDKDANEACRQAKRAAFKTSIGQGCTVGLPLFAQALLNYVGALFIIKGILPFPKVLEVYTLVLFSITFASQAMTFMPQLTKGKIAAHDFARLLALPSATSEAMGDQRFPISGDVAMEHITFCYPSRPDVPVLRDFDLTVDAGECVAIVGPSGSGKSTVAALLQRLYDPIAGKIRMNGFDTANADINWLREHIAVVSQVPQLFDGSIADNIAYGVEVGIRDVQTAAQDAQLHGFISTLPQGYDTMVGEGAAQLSSGQAQRLQLARALVRRSRILILDECTSRLDPDSAASVLGTISELKKSRDRTILFVTHSLEAMRICDRIVCVKDGHVVEDGRFDELVQAGGVFAQLMRSSEWH